MWDILRIYWCCYFAEIALCFIVIREWTFFCKEPIRAKELTWYTLKMHILIFTCMKLTCWTLSTQDCILEKGGSSCKKNKSLCTNYIKETWLRFSYWKMLLNIHHIFSTLLWSSCLVILFDLMCVIGFVYQACSLVGPALSKGLIWNYYKKKLCVRFHLDSSSWDGIISACYSVSKSFVYWYEIVI